MCAQALSIVTEPSKPTEVASLLNRLLRIAVQETDLEVALHEALDVLLSISWLAILPKGGIFLADHARGELQLTAARNMDPAIEELCRRVPFGHCLCGRAAQQTCTQYASCVDERHETRFEGIQPHGHYNLPIIGSGRLLGVLVVYVPHGHRRDELEVSFLEGAADTLALLIQLTQREQTLRGTQTRLASALAESQALMSTIRQNTLFSQTTAAEELRRAQAIPGMDEGRLRRVLEVGHQAAFSRS